MPLVVGVLNDEYRFIKTVNIDKSIQSALFRKLVTTAKYPNLGQASNDTEDITFTPEQVPALVEDINRAVRSIAHMQKMAPEVKARLKTFLAELKEICRIAVEAGRNVEFVAGE